MSLTTKLDFSHFFPQLDELEIAEKVCGLHLSDDSRRLHPLVTGVMVHSNALRQDPRRRGRALRAIKQWQAQSYRNKELVVVNSTGEPLIDPANPLLGVREQMIGGRHTIGAMRNIGIDLAQGEWIKPWDDDDIYSTRLVALQMAFRDQTENRPVMLQCQIRVDFRRGTACRMFDQSGIPATILYPKIEARYADVDDGEDVAFEVSNFPASTLVPNTGFPGTFASIAVFHGWNVQSRERFLGEFASKEHDAKWYLSPIEMIELPKILEDFGLKTTVKPLAPQVSDVKDAKHARR